MTLELESLSLIAQCGTVGDYKTGWNKVPGLLFINPHLRTFFIASRERGREKH